MISRIEPWFSRASEGGKKECRRRAELFDAFKHDESGVAAVELAMILPLLAALLLGVIDAGNALLINKKTMTASQIVADLITRSRTITDTQIDDSIAAARMALQPYGTNSLGVDIVSIQFVGTQATPTVLWRETYNMDENPDALDVARGLGVQNEGVVVVTTRYSFEPVFLHGFFDELNMQEVAVTRGRRGPLVTKVN